MTSLVTGASGALKGEYAFYLADAYIMKVISPTVCKLWLIDHTNFRKVDQWLDGRLPVEVIERELITVDFENSLDHVNEDYRVQLAPSSVEDVPLTELYGDMPLEEMSGQVAIEERLWNQIPEDAQPLPPEPIRQQDYRIKVILKVDHGVATRGFMGFHAQVLRYDSSVHPPRWLVVFFSWTDDLLGAAWVDLHDPDLFDQGHSQIPRQSEGAVFVSLAALEQEPLPFLVRPKVPFGAGIAPTAAAGPMAPRAALPRLPSRGRSTVVCGAGEGYWLRGARARVPSCAQAGTQSELQAFLRNTPGPDPGRVLAFISHSVQRPEHLNLLRFGEFDLTRDRVAALADDFRYAIHGRARAVFLVGCRTAMGEQAQGVLEYLENEFKVKAYGTRRIVGLYDLDASGVRPSRRSRLLADARDRVIQKDDVDREEIEAVGVERPISDQEMGQLIEELVASVLGADVLKERSRTMVTFLLNFLERLRPWHWFEVPGLLAVPVPLWPSSRSAEVPGSGIDTLVNEQLFRITVAGSQHGTSRRSSVAPAASGAHGSSSYRSRSRPIELIMPLSREQRRWLKILSDGLHTLSSAGQP